MRSICHTRGIDMCKMVTKHKFEPVTKKTSKVKTCQRLANKLDRLEGTSPFLAVVTLDMRKSTYAQVNI